MSESQAHVLESAAAERRPLVEAERRLTTFREGVPITLCNGEVWHLPSPRMRFTPMADEAGRYHLVKTRAALGPVLDPILDRLTEAETDGELLGSALELAIFALRQNYRVADDEWPALLWFESDNDQNLEMWRSIIEFGRGDLLPKPSAVGSGTTSSPTASTPTA